MIKVGFKRLTDDAILPVKGFEGYYEVGENGEIYSLWHGRKKLKKIRNNNGYEYVNLYKNKNKTRLYVHRIVAGHFHPNKKEGDIVNHINGVKNDNRSKNLEWVTYKENAMHAKENNLLGNVVPVNKYTLDGVYLESYKSISEAAEKNNLYYPAVKNAVFGHQSSSGGFLWRKGTDTENISTGKHYIQGTKNNTKKVISVCPKTQNRKTYNSIKEASSETGISYSAISKCVTGVNKTSGGLLWVYSKRGEM